MRAGIADSEPGAGAVGGVGGGTFTGSAGGEAEESVDSPGVVAVASVGGAVVAEAGTTISSLQMIQVASLIATISAVVALGYRSSILRVAV